MCLTAHLPALPVPGGAIPPSHYKIYISICHISTPHLFRQASARWALTLEPPTPSLPRWEAEPSVVHLGLQVLPTRGKSTAFIRPSTRKKIHTTPITHARREGPGPPSSPDTRDLRREAEEKRDTPGRPASGTPPGRSVVARHAWWPTWPEGWGARAPGPPLTSKHPAPRTLV